MLINIGKFLKYDFLVLEEAYCRTYNEFLVVIVCNKPVF